jgi:NAD(P)H dehydrogenase (quinone)
MANPYILILYYSRYGATRKLAEQIALGAESVAKIEARLRTVPPLCTILDKNQEHYEHADDLYAEKDDLRYCSGLALGSPTRFGNMAAPLKYFLDTTAEIWLSNDLANKPACVFTSTSSLHGGQESTLLSMMLPLLHHGMLIMGLPYSNAELHQTKTGGTPYGASHVTFGNNDQPLSNDEIQLAKQLGRRIAEMALNLDSAVNCRI